MEQNNQTILPELTDPIDIKLLEGLNQLDQDAFDRLKSDVVNMVESSKNGNLVWNDDWKTYRDIFEIQYGLDIDYVSDFVSQFRMTEKDAVILVADILGDGNLFAYVTPRPVPTATPAPTATPTPEPTATPIPTPTATPVPTATATPVPTATATPVPTAAPIPTPTATPVPTPTATPVPTPTATPIPTPTATPVPTATATPVPTATATPSRIVAMSFCEPRSWLRHLSS